MHFSRNSESLSDGFVSSPFVNLHQQKIPILERIFPNGFKNELKDLLSIYFPIVFTSFFRFLNPMISLIMCGHLSRVEFDAASLANSLINILGVSIDLGFSTAFDTLFAQIYGSDQKKKMGSLLQRALVVMTLIYLILVMFHINVEPILILLRQDPFVAELTTHYITYYLPGLYFDFMFLTISRYLQNQNIVYPMMVSAFLGNIFSGVSQYIAIYQFGYKLEASAILQAVACFVMFILQLGYILIRKVYKETWSGFSLRDCLENWKILFVLGIPGIFMIALEEWNFEVATLVAGAIDGVQLGAQSIAFQCSTISFMLTMGLSISTSIRVGQYLGSREIDGVKTAYRTAIVIGVVSSITSCSLILILRDYIAAAFSSDREIQKEGSQLLLYIAFLQFPDVTAGITSGVLRACGKQIIGASTMFVCYYLIGIPVGLGLIFGAKMNIQGMWIGLMIALFIEGVFFTVFVIRTNWEAEFDKATANVEEIDYDKSKYESSTEKSPLIVKSDYEGDAHWVREKIHNPQKKIYNIKRLRTTSDIFTMPTYRSRSMMLYNTKTLTIESDQPLKKIVIKRVITFAIVFLFVIGAIMTRVYLPKSLYLPCISNSTEALNFFGKDYNNFCKENINRTMSK